MGLPLGLLQAGLLPARGRLQKLGLLKEPKRLSKGLSKRLLQGMSERLYLKHVVGEVLRKRSLHSVV